MESRGYKDIIDDWWVKECEGGTRIPKGREVEVFALLVQTFVDIGYTRSQILRMANDAVAYGINKKAMPKWKSRHEILIKEYKKAISLIMGGTVAETIRPIVPSKDVVVADDIPEETAESKNEIPEEEAPVEKKNKLKLKRVVFTEEDLKEVKKRFSFRIGNDEDIL